MITILNDLILSKIFLIIYVATTTGWTSPVVVKCVLNTLNNSTTQTLYLKNEKIKLHINNDNNHQFTIITNNSIPKILFTSNFEKRYFDFKTKKYENIKEKILIYNILHSHNQDNNIITQYISTIQNNFFHYTLNHKLLSTHHSLTNLPLQHTIIQYTINYIISKIIFNFNNINIIAPKIKKFQYLTSKIEKKVEKLEKINKLKFTQPNTNHCITLFPSKITLLTKTCIYSNKNLQILHTTTNNNKTLLKKNHLPQSIQKQININNNFVIILKKQTYYINKIISQHQKTTENISKVNQTFNKLLEQTQWLNKSPALREILRAQISKLPNIPDFQQLNDNIIQLQKKRFQYENQIKQLPFLLLKSTQDNGKPLTLLQKQILKKQIAIQHNLITLLLNSYDMQILELSKLKILYENLKKTLQKTQRAMYRHLFWVADIHPITTSYLPEIYQDFHKLFIEKKIKKQIISALKSIYSEKTTLILIISSAIFSIGLYIGTNKYYQEFLNHTNKRIGNVNQDNFSITFHNIWYSIIIALPIPIFWCTIGYVFSHLWMYPIVVSIGNSINYTTFILWISIISAYFSSSKGLFITHFGWAKNRLQQVFSRYYILSINIIVLLIMALIIFNNYNEKEFYPTLGRLCFILLCIYLTYITNNLKKSKLPLYINKNNSSNNIINYSLWNIIIFAPIIASIACILGYFFAAQELLIRIETSLFIWILLLIIYYLVKRWMSIQRRRIDFEHAKIKRMQKLNLRNHEKTNFIQHQISNTNNKPKYKKNHKKPLDLDIINTQSLQLIRSIITLIAILLMTLLWSELHPAFSFLENVTLWDVTSTIKGVNNIQPITLSSFLIAILVIIITTKTVHNLPAFLELTLLQHLHLTPGTGYAITTLTKYILMLLGSIIGFSLIGIEWSKIQWLIAALGVGLGFGLQEIFANFISGLMILFEKPIRIGDTVTICNFTGNVTHINTRATTITDWDHKEIIIPNKEFITKQFTNWSLSDTITRVVLKIPGPMHANVKEIISVLIKIVKDSSLALNTPPAEVYLSDLQQGFPIFEIRMYVSDTKLRMPLCHQVHISITEYYQKNGIQLPYLPNYIYNNSLTTTTKKFYSTNF